MAQQFKISFTISTDLLPAIINILSKEVGRLSVEELEQVGSNMPKQRSVTKQTRLCENTCSGVILDALKSGSKTLTELGCALKAGGYSDNSASPVTSKLFKGGHITRIAPSIYQIRNPK